MRVVSSVLSAGVAVLVAASTLHAQTPKPRPAKKKPPPAAVSQPAPPPPPPEPPPSDVTMRMHLVTGIQTSENTTYAKGARQRLDLPGLVAITQCDKGRTVYFNEKGHTYTVLAHATASEPPSAPPAGVPPAASTGAGHVVYTTTVTDTGERKTMFGREARHIRTTTTKDASAATCLKGSEQVDVDGWYVDVPEFVACATAPPAPSPPPGACPDAVERKTVGSASFGTPVSLVTTSTVGDGDAKETVVTSLEVTALEVGRLADSLFDVPAGFTEVATVSDLVQPGGLPDALLGNPADGTAGAVAKRTGVVRIGVLEPRHATGEEIVGSQARRDLVSSFEHGPVEAIAIGGDDTDTIKGQAAQLECDYVLYSEITDVKAKTPGKVGGLLRKASGSGAGPSQEVTVSWKLFPPDNPDTPVMSGTSKASSGGGFGVKSAMHLAALAGSLYLSATGMGGLTSMIGGGPGGGSLFDPRGQAIASIAQAMSAGEAGSDTAQALHVALSKAFDGESKDLAQKLVTKSTK